MDWSHFVPLLQIIGIDLVLSGDNAVIIAMAAHRLPPKQRKQAFVLGAGGAIVLRIIATILVSFLLKIPLLLFAGGLMLTCIALRLLIEQEEAEHHVSAAEDLIHAVKTIMVADFIMSLDNMLAVAGAGREHPGLIVFGLVFSIGIIMTGSVVISNLMNKYPALILIGAGILAWTAGQMIIEDPIVRDRTLFGGAAYELRLRAGETLTFPAASAEGRSALRKGEKLTVVCSGEESACAGVVRTLLHGSPDRSLRGLASAGHGESPPHRENDRTVATVFPGHVADRLFPLAVVVLVLGGAKLYEVIRWGRSREVRALESPSSSSTPPPEASVPVTRESGTSRNEP